MLNLVGTFLTCGGADDPALHFLSAEQTADHYKRDGLASERQTSRRLVNRYSFGVDALHAFPAWSRECMVAVAETYDGHDATLVRGMAATLALGRTLRPVAPSEAPPASATPPAPSAPRGGRPVRPVSPSPAPATPGGGFFDNL